MGILSRPLPPSLDSIPSDALGHILFYVNLQDRLNVRKVCRALEEAVSRTIWYNFKSNSCKLANLEFKEVPFAIREGKPVGSLTVKLGRFRKRYRLEEKGECARFLGRLGCGARVSKVVLCGMTFNTSGTLFVESLLENTVFKSMELEVCQGLEYAKSACEHHRLPEYVRKHKIKITSLKVPGELLTKRDVHVPSLPLVTTFGRLSKPFTLDDETFLRMVDAQHNELVLNGGTVELTEHGLLAAFLAIADNPRPQYVVVNIDLMTAIKFMFFFGSELTWDGFLPSKHHDMQPTVHDVDPNSPNLDTIPSDALGHILYFVNIRDRLNSRRVCRALEASIANTTWHNFIKDSCTLADLHFEAMPLPMFSSKSEQLGFLTVKLGRLRKVFPFEAKADLARFMGRIGCAARVDKVTLSGMTFNASETSFIESILNNTSFKSMKICILHELGNAKLVRPHSRLPEFVRKHKSKITSLSIPNELLTNKAVHLPPLRRVTTVGRVVGEFKIDDETFLRLVDAQHEQLVMQRALLTASHHTLFAAFLAIADNPRPQYVEVIIDRKIAVAFLILMGYTVVGGRLYRTKEIHDFQVVGSRADGNTTPFHCIIHRMTWIFLKMPPLQPECAHMMSIDKWPLELQEKILFFVDLPDRLNVRACCSALQTAVAASNLHLFHPVTSELDNLVFQGMDNNDLMIHFGSKMMMNASTIPLSEDVLKMRNLLGKRIRVNCVVMRKLYFNVAVLSFISRMLINVDFRTMRIEMVNRGEWSRGLGAFINQYADRMDLHIPSLLQDELLHLKPLARVQINVSREGLMGNRIFWSLAEDDFREIVGQRHAVLKTPKGVSWGETMRDVLEKLGNSPCDQVVEFEACDRAVRGLFKLLGFSKPNKKKGFSQPSGQKEYTVKNHLERKRWTNECTIFYKKAALQVTYNREGAEYQTVRGTNHCSVGEKDAK